MFLQGCSDQVSDAFENMMFLDALTWHLRWGYHSSKEIHICSNNKCFCVSSAGDYICKLTLDIFEYESRKRVNVTPIRILANEEMKVLCDNSPVSLNCCSEINVNWSKIEWKQEGKIYVPGKNVRYLCAKKFLSLGQAKMGDAEGGNVRWLFFPRTSDCEKVLGLVPAPA